MRGNIAQLVQQAQKMQDNMQRAQEDTPGSRPPAMPAAGWSASRLAGAGLPPRAHRPVRDFDPEMLEDRSPPRSNDAVAKDRR